VGPSESDTSNRDPPEEVFTSISFAYPPSSDSIFERLTRAAYNFAPEFPAMS
jgi:hypothetical protein